MKQIKVDQKDFINLTRYQFLMEGYRSRYLFSFNETYLSLYIKNYKLYYNELFSFSKKYNLDSLEDYDFNLANSLIIGKEKK